MFKKEITAIELLDGPDEKASDKEIDRFARKQVKALNTSIQKQVKRISAFSSGMVPPVHQPTVVVVGQGSGREYPRSPKKGSLFSHFSSGR